MVRSTRAEPEKRIELAGASLRLDFDPRTSDTMYNYIWVRRPDAGAWERVHNFGIDVRSYRADTNELINSIGMNLRVQPERHSLRVSYPEPLVQYRQFDEKISPMELIRRYPDFPADETRGLIHADASLDFTYAMDPDRPSYEVSGRVASGRVLNAVYIVSALWTENRALPTHGYYEGFPEYDISKPEAFYHRDVGVEEVAYLILYRHDGNGVPCALMPVTPVKAEFNNYFDNWKCLHDFGASCLNQQFVCRNAAVAGSNDSGYTVEPAEDGALAGLRVVFFPELGWLRGGQGHALRDRIERSLIDGYMSGNRADWWDRRKRNAFGRLTLRKGPWE